MPAAAPASAAADAAEHAPWILDLDHVGRRAAGADEPADESVALHLDPAALAYVARVFKRARSRVGVKRAGLGVGVGEGGRGLGWGLGGAR